MKRTALVLVALAGLAGVAAAGPSGGSIGGASWSSGAGGGGGGVGGIRGPIESMSNLRSGPDSWPGLLAFAGALIVVVGIHAIPWRGRHTQSRRVRDPLCVSRLCVAFAPRARASLTRALCDLARASDPSKAEGRAALLASVALLLRHNADSAAYAVADTERTNDRRAARAVFACRAHEARAAFRDERVRDHNGMLEVTVPSGRELDGDDSGARSGFTVVTLLLATRTPLFQPVRDRTSLDAAIAALTAEPLTAPPAIELIWMPSDVDEPLTSVAVEARIPDLNWLESTTAGAVGCSSCSARSPAEDLCCPRCGARASIR